MFKKIDRDYLDIYKLNYKAPSLVSLIESAWKKGVVVEYMQNGGLKNIVRLSKGEAFFYIFNTNSYSSMSAFSHLMAADKLSSFNLMLANSVPTPKTYTVDDFVAEVGMKYVYKPRFGSKGDSVYFFEGEGWRNIEVRNIDMIIQEFHCGKDLRIQAVGGKFFAACVREPANVVGDGKSTIENLIDLKNTEKLPGNRILKDKGTEAFLENYDLKMESVLEEGRKVYLTDLSNISLGGDIWDVTEEVHSSYYDLVARIGRAFKERNYAVDIVVDDFSKEWHEGGAQVIEINSPNMWYHHLIAKPNGRDVGDAILEDWLANPDLY